MKKFVSFLIALSVAAMLSAPAFASDIAVKVDGRTVAFREEPKPTIINDRTYVPIRRVLEYMGAKVEWNGENRTVRVTSYNNVIIVDLTIDSTEIDVYTFTSVLHADKKTIQSDVAPIILNDRTMLPIRVIAEALGADVEYDERGIAEITTSRAKMLLKNTVSADAAKSDQPLAVAISENLPKVSIYSDAENVKAGDTVSVYVKLSDIEPTFEKSEFAGFVTTVTYEPDKFSYSGFTPISDEGDISSALAADNGNFYENGVKIAYIYSPGNLHAPAEDGTVLRIDFTALSDEGGTFALSDGVSEIGFDNEVLFIRNSASYSISKYNELFIDTTEIEVK